jgi:hypothetical protein
MDRKMGLSCKSFKTLCVFLAFLQAFPLLAMQNEMVPSPALNTAAQKVMNQVKKVPVGGKLTVLKMDGTEYHGHLQAVGSQDFTFVEVDLKQTLTFPYSEVEKVSKNYGGKGISGKRVNPRRSLIVVTVILGGLFTVLIVALAKDKS